jgi:hypothetical protein
LIKQRGWCRLYAMRERQPKPLPMKPLPMKPLPMKPLPIKL